MAPSGMTTTMASGEVRNRKATEATLELAPPSPVEEVKGPVYPDIQTIKDAIPAKCFERSYVRSFGYLIRDLVMITSFGWAGLTFIPQIEHSVAQTVAWIVYGYIQGLIDALG